MEDERVKLRLGSFGVRQGQCALVTLWRPHHAKHEVVNYALFAGIKSGGLQAFSGCGGHSGTSPALEPGAGFAGTPTSRRTPTIRQRAGG